MSLTSFIDIPDVSSRLKLLRPKSARKFDVPLKAESRTNHYMLVGTAFDYFLRFELQRRVPHAISERWVAEYAPDIILRKTDRGGMISMPLPEPWIDAAEMQDRARQTIEAAKKAVAGYIKEEAPDQIRQRDLAGHAIRLAKLDSVFRANYLDISFEEVDPEDVQDLLDMLAIVPFESFLSKEVLLLNPNFKESSHLVGGADCDLITGDLLVDFKVTKKNEIQVKFLDQVLGYLLLARRQRHVDQTFPTINKLGLYFCRHGYLWTMGVATWTEHPQFLEIEEWFFKHAREVFGSR